MLEHHYSKIPDPASAGTRSIQPVSAITCEGSLCVKWVPSIVHRRFVVTLSTIVQGHRGTGYYSENIEIYRVFVYCNNLFDSEK